MGRHPRVTANPAVPEGAMREARSDSPSSPGPAVAEDGSTRQRILDEALVLFAGKGFAGTSIRQLARAVGVRESSIYNHFSGKEDIYRKLIEQWGPAAFVERLESPEYRALADDPAAFCRRCATDLIERWMDRRERLFVAVINGEQSAFKEGRVRFYDTLFRAENERLAEYFQGFMQAGLIRSIDARETARTFSSGLICLRMEYVNGPEGPAPRRLLEGAMARYLDTFLFLVGAS
jgi:AcrR family transcriptional regulator